ncbi:inorganic phosphate transporter [Thermoplasmatales archaeon SW_10_69_26]|nr:MAG: inorganic phosphate transporter [Thermoplasmatales archaeon SW_10_69_26]
MVIAGLGLLGVVGVVTAAFVGVNIGGSSTGVAFGPATGAGVLGKRWAMALMAVFALVGGLVVGPNVVDTLGTEFVAEEHFTLAASTAVMLFIGLSILVANLVGVSTGTSYTAVGAVVGMGAALGVLDWGTVGEVVTWWFVAGMAAFWLSAITGRYLFGHLEEFWQADTDRAHRLQQGIVVLGGCFVAFSAGASNVANAVAPLVGSGTVGMVPAVVIGGLAIGAGGFLLGGRTMETVGNEITQLPLHGWIVVMVLTGSIITFLSWLGIPASLAVKLQLCVMGLGWGRTTREMSLMRTLGFEPTRPRDRARMEEGSIRDYDVATTRRIVSMWLITPVMAGALAFATFAVATRYGLLGV